MIEVIPAIIAKNFKGLKRKIKLVEPYSKWAQLDVMDGKFVLNTTWNNPSDLKNIGFLVLFEVHLMIDRPEKYIDKWLNSGVKRIIVHIEAVGETSLINDISEKCQRKDVEFGVAINPETPEDALGSIIDKVDLVLFLTVHPGFGGQKFLKEVLSKIESFRQKHPYVKIEVDGGINPETGKKCIEAGADILVSGSYVLKSKNIAQAIEKLKNI